jgi:hypothetical protein
LFQSQTTFAWTYEGHTCVNRVAAEKIPASMPSFLRQASQEIAYLGPEPDRWRDPAEWALKTAQEPDHFILLERISWMQSLPKSRYDFYRKLYEKRSTTPTHPDDYLPESVGLQPYIVAEIYGRLKLAFQEYRSMQRAHRPTSSVQQAIIFYAGWLGHYVADGCQPLHTTIQYDGWKGPNPKRYRTEPGIHLLFESTYVAANIKPENFAAQVHSPKKLEDPFAAYVDYLQKSSQLSERVYVIEKAGGFAGKGSKEAYEFTTERLAAGSQMLLDLWYTAWIASAEPASYEHSVKASTTN